MQKDKTIRITCKGADLIPLSELSNFQGNIKRMSDVNHNKLKKRILKDGVNVPFFIWKNGQKHYILDGHQRLSVLTGLAEEGYSIPPVPVAYIEAKDKTDAKEKLLAIASQYGEYDLDELELFISDIDLDDMRLVGGEIDLDSFIEDGLSNDRDVLDNEIIDATADVMIKIQDHEIKAGYYQFVVPHDKYVKWINKIKKDKGFEYDDVISGIKEVMSL